MFHLTMRMIYVFKTGCIGTEWGFVEYLVILMDDDNHIVDITNNYLKSDTKILTQEITKFLYNGGYNE